MFYDVLLLLCVVLYIIFALSLVNQRQQQRRTACLSYPNRLKCKDSCSSLFQQVKLKKMFSNGNIHRLAVWPNKGERGSAR